MNIAIPFIFSTTTDGSRTLAHPETLEKMHHESGAFSETVHVYGRAMKLFLEKTNRFFNGGLSIATIGLGLGYIELMAIAYAVADGREARLQLTSWEHQDFLVETFQSWLSDEKQPSQNSFFECYESALARTAEFQKLDRTSLKSQCQKLYRSGRWRFEKEFGETPRDRPILARESALLVFYDLFSSRTTPNLWSAQFLDNFISNLNNDLVVFASYSACGNLKRALKRSAFENLNFQGFSKKRECTIAYRDRQTLRIKE